MHIIALTSLAFALAASPLPLSSRASGGHLPVPPPLPELPDLPLSEFSKPPYSPKFPSLPLFGQPFSYVTGMASDAGDLTAGNSAPLRSRNVYSVGGDVLGQANGDLGAVGDATGMGSGAGDLTARNGVPLRSRNVYSVGGDVLGQANGDLGAVGDATGMGSGAGDLTARNGAPLRSRNVYSVGGDVLGQANGDLGAVGDATGMGSGAGDLAARNDGIAAIPAVDGNPSVSNLPTSIPPASDINSVFGTGFIGKTAGDVARLANGARNVVEDIDHISAIGLADEPHDIPLA